MKKRMSWYWAVPGATGLALIMAAVMLLVSTAGHTPTASAQAGCTLTLTKTVAPTAPADGVPVGAEVTYTIVVTADAASTAACEDVVVTDAIPADMNCLDATESGSGSFTDAGCAADGTVTWTAGADLAIGQTATLTMVAEVEANIADDASITNTAAVDALQGATLPEDASATFRVNGCELTIAKDADDNEVGEGGEITYTITVENEGDVDCLDVVITENIPDDTDCVDTGVTADSDLDEGDFDVAGCDGSGDVVWDGFDLNNGDVVEVTMTVDLTSGAEDGDEIANIACVTTEAWDDVNGDEIDCDEMTVDVEGVAATATPTVGPTATRGPTAQPLPTIQAPPPVPTARPIAPPITGTGPDGGSGPLALGLGLIGACLLLVSGAALVKRTR